MRSKFIDLLFPDELKRRVEGIMGILDGRGNPIPGSVPPMKRVTLFLTHRCNLRCAYCNGPHMIPSEGGRKQLGCGDFKLDTYLRLIKEWKAAGLKYIHFTGGEPTLHPQITEFIKAARKLDILTSITSNGTMSPELLSRILDAGNYEFRISLDSPYEKEHDEMTGIKGSFRKTLNTIKALAAEKSKGRDIFTVVNITMNSPSLDNLEANIRDILKFPVDDIKLLFAAEERCAISGRYSRAQIEHLLNMVKEHSPKRAIKG